MTGSEPAQKVRLNKGKATEERRLIEAAQRDPVCFAGLYESYFELVYVYVARRVRNRVSMSKPGDQAYGDRVGAVKDPFDNVWYIGTHLKAEKSDSTDH